MPTYLMMTNLTDEGRKTLKANPQRLLEVNQEVEMMGVKIVAQYAVLGDFDFLNVLEAPNNESVSKLAIELGARGTLQPKTYAAVELNDFINNLKS